MTSRLEFPHRKISTSAQLLLQCQRAKNTAKRALNYLNARCSATEGELPYGGGFTGTPTAGSAMAAIALIRGQRKPSRRHPVPSEVAETWVTANGNDSPAALAMLSLVATASGEPGRTGGINLPSVWRKPVSR